jgi:hypothetical protein
MQKKHTHKNQHTTPHADKYLISVSPQGRIRKEGIDKPPHHTILNKIVGGSIELVPYFDKYDGDPCVAFCNENGKGLPFNKFAHELWEKAFGRTITEDHLVGSIAIIVGPLSFLRQL